MNTIEQVGIGRHLPDARQFRGNSLIAIHPYKSQGIWQFDDERIGVTGELFVGDTNKIIDELVEKAGIKRPKKGFRAIFSAQPFPGYHIKLNLTEEIWESGHTYRMDGSEIEGWFCPVLLCFFTKAPKNIYVRAENL